MTGDLPPAPPRLVPVKFFGGLLAIGAGMALGREGPSVQMGAVVADLVGKWFRRCLAGSTELLAAGAGAGLAVAFNAPIAGAVFVLEELVRRLETRIAIVALGASSTAILISRLFLGNAPDFLVAVSSHAATATGPLPYAVAATWPFYLASGRRRNRGQPLQPHDPRRDFAGGAARPALPGRNPGGGYRRGGRDHRLVRAGADRRRRRDHPARAGRRRRDRRDPARLSFALASAPRATPRAPRRAVCADAGAGSSARAVMRRAVPNCFSRPRHRAAKHSPSSRWRRFSPASSRRR